MESKIIWAINIILAIAILATLVWAFPYFASAFYMGLGSKALEAALEEPEALESRARAVNYLQQAVRWDRNNAEASELLAKAYRQLAEVYVGRGELAEARSALEALLEQDPEDQFALYYLARAYEEAGERGKAAENYERLRYFELEEGGKIPAYLGGLSAKLEEYGIWGQDEVVNIVSFLVWQGEWGQAEELLARMAMKYPHNPEWAFYRGEMYHRRGELEEALRNYERAIGLDSRYAQAYLRIGRAYEDRALASMPEARSADLQEAARWYKMYHALAPENLLGLKKLVEICEELEWAGIEPESLNLQPEALREELERRLAEREPEYKVGQKVGEDWVLVGYDLDEEALKMWSETTIWLYWQPSKPVEMKKPGWHWAGERWVEVREVRNLVPNGGFEWDLKVGPAYPYGWPSGIYKAPLECHELVVDERNGEKTKCARLSNSQTYQSTSFASIEIPIKPGAIYLQAGWIKSEGGKGYLGRRWMGKIEEKPPYNYVVRGVKAESWTHYAGIARPPEGATSCHLWLLNYKSTGKVYFDDILFVELELPEG